MNNMIKYYFWYENYKHEWVQLGKMNGYNTAKECKNDNTFSIQVAELEGLCWKILEAKPMK